MKYAPLTALIAGVLIGLGLICVFGVPTMSGSSNYGFGPDWTCMPQPKGGPICFRNH